MNAFFPRAFLRLRARFAPSYRWRERIKRWLRAWRYANGTWTADDAGWIAHEAHPVAGYAVLETFDVAGVIEWAEDRFGRHPKMEEWARSAVERVAYKWNSPGDAASAAQDWAVDLIVGYAAADGVDLVEREA